MVGKKDLLSKFVGLFNFGCSSSTTGIAPPPRNARNARQLIPRRARLSTSSPGTLLSNARNYVSSIPSSRRMFRRCEGNCLRIFTPGFPSTPHTFCTYFEYFRS
ncbi:hypothetical protein ACJIZ3_013843 [Penstemon smallii]|uniref:Secreted protein n=1 Tax=Penstemon smallii TaxID=265156 RepID=A0ABD3RI03_9LAMI